MEEPEVYGNYDSEGNIIIPPRVIERKEERVIPTILKEDLKELNEGVKKDTKKKLNPNITKANPDAILGRRIVGAGGKAGRPKPRV
jgi:hypothetical protein